MLGGYGFLEVAYCAAILVLHLQNAMISSPWKVDDLQRWSTHPQRDDSTFWLFAELQKERRLRQAITITISLGPSFTDF